MLALLNLLMGTSPNNWKGAILKACRHSIIFFLLFSRSCHEPGQLRGDSQPYFVVHGYDLIVQLDGPGERECSI